MLKKILTAIWIADFIIIMMITIKGLIKNYSNNNYDLVS